VLTQTKPFPPPAAGAVFATGFAGLAEPEATPGVGMPAVAVVLGALECFFPGQLEFDGAAVGATAGGVGAALTGGVDFL
jgi:hypothetical protein